MVSATNQQAYGQSPWGNGPQYANNPPDGPPFWYPRPYPHPLGIVAIVLGFVFWWPIGLMLLFMMKWSGYMGCWGRRHRAQWGMNQSNGGWQGPFQGWAPWKAWNAQPQTAQPQGSPSGNHAFDEYRTATLRRLEDEQQEFGSFLERLRFAKDKAEFDQFMSERRERPMPPSGPPPGPPPGPESQPHV